MGYESLNIMELLSVQCLHFDDVIPILPPAVYYGFGSCGSRSAVSLSSGDVAVDSHQDPSVILVFFKQSKMGPFCKGVSIYLDRTGMDLYPVAAILVYIAVRPRTGGTFFRYRDGLYLTRNTLMATIRRALVAEEINVKGFTGHNFRVGAAITAALVGIEDSVIKMLGRWELTIYQRYLWTPREALAAVSTRLVA